MTIKRILSVESSRRIYTIGDGATRRISFIDEGWGERSWFRIEAMDGSGDTLVNVDHVISVRISDHPEEEEGNGNV